MKMFSYLGYGHDHKVKTVKVAVRFEGKRFVAHDSIKAYQDRFTVTHKQSGLRIALALDEFSAIKLVKDCDRLTSRLPLLLCFMPWYRQAELIKQAIMPAITSELLEYSDRINSSDATEAN